ncbi:MAG: EamA family transporter [Propionibacteriaceae bacterium]
MPPSSTTRSGLAIALLSAATFGMAGALATPLLRAGWTPGAVVLVRVGVAAVVLAVPAAILLRRSWRLDRRASVYLIAYGLTAIAGAQLCFFSAVQYLPVGVALLLEYLAPVLLIGWRWWRTRLRPRTAVLLGAGIAMLGMVGVLDLLGPISIHPLGVAYGLGAALCLCCYFVLSEQQREPVPAVAVAAGGTAVGAIAIALAGLVGVLPMRFVAADVTLRGVDVAWWVPAGLLILVSCVVAYLTGIVAVRRLGSQNASFVALTEVLFAVVAAVVLINQTPTVTQLVGGVLVLAGIVCVQRFGTPTQSGTPAGPLVATTPPAPAGTGAPR